MMAKLPRNLWDFGRTLDKLHRKLHDFKASWIRNLWDF